jgi:hypothetical protein
MCVLISLHKDYAMLKFPKIIFLFCLAGSCAVGAQAQSGWDTILAGADIGDMMVTSGAGNCVYEYTRVDSLGARAQQKDQEHSAGVDKGVKTVIRNDEKIDISFSFNGQKIRCDESSYNRLPTGKWYTQDWQWAYNGEKLDLLRYDGLSENGLIVPNGSIRVDYPSRITRFDPRHNGFKIMGTPVGVFLRGRLGENTVNDLQVIREESIDTIGCTVIRGHVVNTGDTIIVWLAPSLMYRPKRIQYSSGDELTVVNNHFKEYSGGIWFPDTIIDELFYRDTDGKWITYSRGKISVINDFIINTDLSASLFEIKFPKGLWVYDNRLGKKFEIK